MSTQIAYCLSEGIGNELKEIQSEPSNTSMGIAVPEGGGGVRDEDSLIVKKCIFCIFTLSEKAKLFYLTNFQSNNQL